MYTYTQHIDTFTYANILLDTETLKHTCRHKHDNTGTHLHIYTCSHRHIHTSTFVCPQTRTMLSYIYILVTKFNL